MNWKQREIGCLKQNFPTMPDVELAKVIGRSPNALRIKASRLRIKKETSSIRENLKLNPIEEQVVIGGLLGDLHCRITKTSKNARLEGSHGEKQKEYLLWKANLLKRLRIRPRKTKINTYWYDSKSFKILNKYHYLFYKKGFKFINKDILNLLNDFGLLIWYLDDGSYSKRDRNINLYTNGFSYEEQVLIKEWFEEKYGLNPKIYRRKGPKDYPRKVWYFIHFNVKDAKKLLNLFGRFQIPDCMKYKLGASCSTIQMRLEN